MINLDEIFSGREVTVCNEGCFIDRWHPRRNPIKISNELCQYLIDMKALQEDSGNFETGEVHYTYSKLFGKMLTKAISTMIGFEYEWLIKDLKLAQREVNLSKLL
jgi:hypothetical protein